MRLISFLTPSPGRCVTKNVAGSRFSPSGLRSFGLDMAKQDFSLAEPSWKACQSPNWPKRVGWAGGLALLGQARRAGNQDEERDERKAEGGFGRHAVTSGPVLGNWRSGSVGEATALHAPATKDRESGENPAGPLLFRTWFVSKTLTTDRRDGARRRDGAPSVTLTAHPARLHQVRWALEGAGSSKAPVRRRGVRGAAPRPAMSQ